MALLYSIRFLTLTLSVVVVLDILLHLPADSFCRCIRSTLFFLLGNSSPHKRTDLESFVADHSSHRQLTLHITPSGSPVKFMFVYPFHKYSSVDLEKALTLILTSKIH